MERRFTCVVLLGLCLVVALLCQNVDGRKLTKVKEEDVKKPEWFFGDSSVGQGDVGGVGGDGGYGGGDGGYGGGIGGGIGKGIVGGVGGYGGIGGGIYKGIGIGIGGGIGAIGGVGGALQHVEANNKP